MEFERLTKEQLKKIYENRMMEDFPEAELKPYDAMTDMMDKNCYDALVAIKDGVPVGYALLTMVPGQDYLLLDYLAVFKEARLKGCGSLILEKLKEHYSGKTIFIESENPNFQEGNAKTVAKKRLAFYEKNGAVDTGVLTKIWTVPYINYVLGENVLSGEAATKALSLIYEIMIPNESTRNRMVEIPQKEVRK